MKQRKSIQTVSKNTFGLALVFERVVSGICLVVMIISPIAPIFAFAADDSVAEGSGAEVESSSVPETQEVTTEQELDTETETESTESEEPVVVPAEPSTETDVVASDELIPEDAPSLEEVVTEPVPPPTSTVPVALSEPTPETLVTTQTTESEVGTSSEVIPEVVLSNATDTVSETVEEVLTSEELVAPETPLPDIISDQTESSTEEVSTDVPEGETVTLSAITNDENRFVFGKSECVSAGDETFYCTKGTADTGVSHADRVFSAVDNDGDKEVFVERNAVVTKITNNNQDDDAPYYDELSNTLVWHKLIDGRYQIMSYDMNTSVETQITHDRFNNMEPHRYGETTVWQGWIGNDWEIMMLKGDELTMLTDNNTHDITPSINGDHIVWQSFEDDTWKMKVYDTRSKEIQTIEDSAGGSIENPRFVLVYDTKLESGDVETRGFNLETGEVVSLGAKPVSVPENIPEPDQTGEKRALVAPPVQPKTKIDESDDVPDTTGSGEPPQDPTLGDTHELVIPPLLNQNDSGTTTIEVGTSTLSDVTVLPLENASSSVRHIEDLVVPTFVSEVTEPSDSQVPIVEAL